MITRLRRALYPLGLGLGLLIFGYQLLRGYQSFSQGLVAIQSLTILVWASAAGMAAIAVQMLAWFYLMRALGARLPFWPVLGGYVLAFLPRYIPGTVWGYLSRSHWLNRSYGVPYQVSTAGSLLEMLLTCTSAVVMGSIYAATVWAGWAQLMALATAVLLPIVVWGLTYVFARWPLVQRILPSQVVAARLFGLKPAQWTVILVLDLIAWVLYGGVVANSLEAFGLMSPNWLTVSMAYSTSWLIGFLVLIVPTGLGVRELALTNLLS
jgi:glycosyltransferase 2 family protein